MSDVALRFGFEFYNPDESAISDSKETHKASFTVQASVRLLGAGLLLVSKFYGQATKGTRRMPWHFEAMKDVASCEKLRLGASIR